MRNYINIHIKKDKIVIKFEDGVNINDIEYSLGLKIQKIKRIYQSELSPIYIKGKTLKSEEIELIKKMINEVCDAKIEFEVSQTLGLHGIKKSFNKEITSSETKFHRGSLRSGQKIEFEGSIVIIGDVNVGAEVIAGENIVVLGVLRGLAHAGAKGNKNAIISAQAIMPLQIRIADIVKEIDVEEKELTLKSRNYAYVNENEEIIIE